MRFLTGPNFFVHRLQLSYKTFQTGVRVRFVKVFQKKSYVKTLLVLKQVGNSKLQH